MSDFQILSQTGVWLSATERVPYATFGRLFKSMYATKRVVYATFVRKLLKGFKFGFGHFNVICVFQHTVLLILVAIRTLGIGRNYINALHVFRKNLGRSLLKFYVQIYYFLPKIQEGWSIFEKLRGVMAPFLPPCSYAKENLLDIYE